MREEQVENAAALSADTNEKIAAFIAADESQPSGKEFKTGIRNSDGAITKTIISESLPEFKDITQFLLDLGMSDEIDEFAFPKDGFDSIFS